MIPQRGNVIVGMKLMIPMRQGASIVKLKVKGAADFLGESPIALEDGKTAFFVKTRAKQVGTITCSAHAQGLTKAKTAIKVYTCFQ